MDALKRRAVEDERRAKEAAVAAFKGLLERSALKASSTWRKVQHRLQDAPEFDVSALCVWVCIVHVCMCACQHSRYKDEQKHAGMGQAKSHKTSGAGWGQEVFG